MKHFRESYPGLGYTATPLGNQNALSEAFVFGDGVRLERLADEVAGQDEGAIVLDIAPSEVEESVLGLEVANLQDAVDLGHIADPRPR